jgi:hypothetical protein
MGIEDHILGCMCEECVEARPPVCECDRLRYDNDLLEKGRVLLAQQRDILLAENAKLRKALKEITETLPDDPYGCGDTCGGCKHASLEAMVIAKEALI